MCGRTVGTGTPAGLGDTPGIVDDNCWTAGLRALCTERARRGIVAGPLRPLECDYILADSKPHALAYFLLATALDPADDVKREA